MLLYLLTKIDFKKMFKSFYFIWVIPFYFFTAFYFNTAAIQIKILHYHTSFTREL